MFTYRFPIQVVLKRFEEKTFIDGCAEFFENYLVNSFRFYLQLRINRAVVGMFYVENAKNEFITNSYSMSVMVVCEEQAV